MLYLQCKLSSCWRLFFPVFLGISSVLVYSSSDFFLFLLLCSTLLGLYQDLTWLRRICIPIIVLAGCINLISPPVALAIAACLALPGERFRFLLALCVPQITFIASAIVYLTELSPCSVSEAIPTLVVLAIFSLIFFKRILYFLLIGIVALCCTYVCNAYVVSSVPIQFLSSVFIAYASTATPKQRNPIEANYPSYIYFCLGLFLVCDFLWLSPKLPSELVFFTQENTPYFTNYQGVLNFSGISAKVQDNLTEIKIGATVIFPDLSVTNHSDQLLDSFRKEAIKKSWTVILVGEHNNMMQVSQKIEKICGEKRLADDLFVPRNNADSNGLLRTSSILGWNPKTELNRGATPIARRITDKVLLSADDWWRESTASDSQWVGDYIRSSSDKSGRLPIAISFDRDGVRWVVISDSSPFLNTFVMSNPSAITQLCGLATNLPSFAKDLVFILFLLCCLVCRLQKTFFYIVAIACGLLCESVSSYSMDPRNTVCTGKSAFETTNFNKQIVTSPSLLNTSLYLELSRTPISKLPEKRESLLFAHIAGNFYDKYVGISNCKRIGNVQTKNLKLMNAQACEIHGEAEVLIGDKTSAAAIRVPTSNLPLIIIFDIDFLSQNSPRENVLWLEKILKDSTKSVSIIQTH